MLKFKYYNQKMKFYNIVNINNLINRNKIIYFIIYHNILIKLSIIICFVTLKLIMIF